MLDWLNALPIVERVFLFIAAPASLILVFQTIMLFFGAADGGLDSDVSGLDSGTDGLDGFDADIGDAGDLDGGFDGSGDFAEGTGAGLQFITMRGIIALLTMFGWSGLCAMEAGLSVAVSILIAAVLGFGALVGIAYVVKLVLSLQSIHPLNYRQALGQNASVYLTVPASGQGMGKVSLALDGALREYDAVTLGDAPIKTGDVVRVTDLMNGSVMVVEKE